MGWGVLGGERVEFLSGGVPIRAHLGRPAAPGRYPAVIVLHAMPGWIENVRRATERLGDEGYVGLVMDWRSREEDPPDSELMRYVADAAAYLRGLEYVDGDRIAVTGYCRGGGLVLLALAHHPWLRAGISFHGDAFYRALDAKKPQHAYDLADRIQAPVMILHGAADDVAPVQDMYRFAQRLESLGKRFVLKVYSGTGHAFGLPGMKAYDPAVAADAWQEGIAFLDCHLRP